MENNYKQDDERYFQRSEQKDNSDLNMSALDLSRKKNVISSTLWPEFRNETVGSSQTLPTSIKKRYRQDVDFLDVDTQSPVASSSAMLSPCSESNSPKRTMTDAVDYYGNSSQHTATLTNTRNVTPGVTIVTPQQPSLPVIPNEATYIPVPIIPIPHMETSQSSIINNENRRKISLLPAECSTSTDPRSPTSSQDATKKAPRPFKAYPNNILSVVPTIDHNSNVNYADFRKRMLATVKTANGNTNMRRVSKSPGLPTSTVEEKDAAYWERRRKNNEAAKRSRDARRAKEDELAIRTAWLERENASLKLQLKALIQELVTLRQFGSIQL